MDIPDIYVVITMFSYLPQLSTLTLLTEYSRSVEIKTDFRNRSILILNFLIRTNLTEMHYSMEEIYIIQIFSPQV